MSPFKIIIFLIVLLSISEGFLIHRVNKLEHSLLATIELNQLEKQQAMNYRDVQNKLTALEGHLQAALTNPNPLVVGAPTTERKIK